MGIETAIEMKRCPHCGHAMVMHLYRCPSCGLWDFGSADGGFGGGGNGANGGRTDVGSDDGEGTLEMTPLSEVEGSNNKRSPTGPWDACFGGGLVSNSVTLLAGDPGAGKSTISLLILEALLKGRKKEYQRARYNYAEGAGSIVRDYGSRMGLTQMPRIDVLPAFLPLDELLEYISKAKKRYPLVVDSISAMTENREAIKAACMVFKEYAERVDAPVFLLTHINKKGDVSGVKALEHLVDTVLMFRIVYSKREATSDRVLSVSKSRVGPNVTVKLRMVGKGLELIKDDPK